MLKVIFCELRVCNCFVWKGESVMSDETITPGDDNDTSLEGEGVPALNLEDDDARPDSTARNTSRSTLERYWTKWQCMRKKKLYL